MVFGDLDNYIQKNETQPPTYTTHKNKLKMDKRLKYKFQHCKSFRRTQAGQVQIFHAAIFSLICPIEQARDIKKRINIWDFNKIKNFFMAKESISKMKREPTVWGNIFANDNLDKSLISEIYKELT